MTAEIGFLHIGPERHGVTRYGRALGRAMPTATELAVGDIGSFRAFAQASGASAADAPGVWMVQFTDHLFGADPGAAADAMAQLITWADPATVAVTMHDVPSGDDDRRRTAYRRVAELAAVVVVCSEHERRLLCGCGVRRHVDVIPHFVEGRQRCISVQRSTATVGVLGFVYPGKGHLAVLQACAPLDVAVSMTALGAASPGHDHMVDELLRCADRLQVPFTVTGWIPDDELDARLGLVDVPVAPNESISASGSISTWMGVGRRPIVRSGPYVTELLRRAPGAVTTYDPARSGALTDRIAAALADPDSTHGAGVPDGLRIDEVASLYVQALIR